MVYDASLDYPFEEVFLTVEDQCNDCAEAGPAVPDALEILQQQAVVGRKVVSVGGVAGRVHAGGPAQRLDFEPGVVGEAVQTGTVMEVVSLLRGISFEGLLLFGNLFGDAAFAGASQACNHRPARPVPR